MNKKALHKISYGLYIVASHMDGKINGQIANTVFQITSQPVTVAVSLNKENLTHEFVEKNGAFAVSILSQNAPMEFIGLFGFRSGREIDKFKDVNFFLGNTSCPIVRDYSVGFLEGKVTKKIDCGTHTLFIGEIIDADILSDEEPMTYSYYHKIKGGKSPKRAPTYIEESSKEEGMSKYRCSICGYVYDPEKGDPSSGIAPGTPFDKLPEDWVCPVCGASKDQFEEL